MARFNTIRTPRLIISPFEDIHLTAKYVSWLNDPEVVKYSEQRHTVHTIDSCRAYLRTFDNTPHLFGAIVVAQPRQWHIGNINAYIDPHNALADVGILIGERGAWHCGYGFEAWAGLCAYLFEIQNIRKITTGTMSENTPMIRICQKYGMTEDGRRQRHYLLDGVETDVLHYGKFRDTPHPEGETD